MINKINLIGSIADVDLVYIAALFNEKIYHEIEKTMLEDEEGSYGKDAYVMRKIAKAEIKGLLAKVSHRIYS